MAVTVGGTDWLPVVGVAEPLVLVDAAAVMVSDWLVSLDPPKSTVPL